VNWRPVDLANQYRRALALGWVQFAKDLGWFYDFDPAVILAVGSRETRLKNIIGDHGHGHGVMQIDDRSFPEWCVSGKWRDSKEALRMGVWVLSKKREHVIARGVPPADVLRVSLASYNAGEHPIEDYFRNHSPDKRTTDGNYGADVLKRAAEFRNLMK
jgi:hypothetical protein